MLFHAFCGLVLVRLLPALFLGPRLAFGTYSAYSVQFEVGAVVVLACAWLGAPRLAATGARAVTEPVALAVGSFVAGAFAAGWTNFFLSGGPRAQHGVSEYIIKPLFWFGLFGVPTAFLLGAVLSWSLNRRGR